MSNESQQVQVTQEDIRIIKHDVSKLSTTLEKVHTAIVGSELGKDGGLVQRVVEVEIEAISLSERIKIIENEKIKSDVYKKITFFLAGGVVSALIVAIIRHFLN